MKGEPTEPFDAELDALLEMERRREAPMEALGRVWSRLGAGPPPGDSHGARGAGNAGRQWLASHAAHVAFAAFALGGGTGAAVYAAVDSPRPPQIVYVDRVVSPPPSEPFQTSPPVVASSTPDLTTVSPPLARAPAPAPAHESLADERLALDRARTELTGGHAGVALALLEDHARRYRKPQLAEEREALAIQSLIALGRYEEAKTRGARFREATPNSLFIPVIEMGLGSIP